MVTTATLVPVGVQTEDVIVDTVVGDAILPIHEQREVAVGAKPHKRECE